MIQVLLFFLFTLSVNSLFPILTTQENEPGAFITLHCEVIIRDSDDLFIQQVTDADEPPLLHVYRIEYGEWILAYGPACPDVLRPPVEIKAGSSYKATIQLHPSTWDSTKKNSSWYGGDIEGTYRIREKVYGEWSRKKFDNNTLKSEIVVSNTFDIRRAP